MFSKLLKLDDEGELIDRVTIFVFSFHPTSSHLGATLK